MSGSPRGVTLLLAGLCLVGKSTLAESLASVLPRTGSAELTRREVAELLRSALPDVS